MLVRPDRQPMHQITLSDATTRITLYSDVWLQRISLTHPSGSNNCVVSVSDSVVLSCALQPASAAAYKVAA